MKADNSFSSLSDLVTFWSSLFPRLELYITRKEGLELTVQRLASSGSNQSEHATTDGCSPGDPSTLQLWSRGLSTCLAQTAEIKANILTG